MFESCQCTNVMALRECVLSNPVLFEEDRVLFRTGEPRWLSPHSDTAPHHGLQWAD